MAITFNSANGVLNATSYVHTVAAGTDRIAIVAARSISSAPTAVTFGGVAMTQIGTNYSNATSGIHNYWYVFNPAVGANTVVMTGGTFPVLAGQVYNGVPVQATPWYSYDTDGTGSVSTVTENLVSANANDWGIAMCGGQRTASAGANSTARYIDAGAMALFDSNGGVPVGAFNMTQNVTSGPIDNVGLGFILRANVVASATNSNFFALM